MAQDPWEKVVAALSAEMTVEPIQFFATFSRFEWSLGQEGEAYTLKPSNPGISWDRVGQAFGGRFYKLVKEGQAASRIIADPPKAIVNIAGIGLQFDAAPPPCDDASAVFKALARIRNNFFHGWKAGLDADDRQHIADGLAVLRIAYDFCDGHPKLNQVAYRLLHV